MPAPAARRPGTFESLGQALTSWRTAAVSLLAFSSGMPLGLIWIAIPDWLRSSGVDIKTVGLITLAQAPWTFKLLWSPLMDRYAPPFLGRRRGWIALMQLALFVGTLVLAGVGRHPELPWVIGAVALGIAFAAASQDIAFDAYAVDVLRPEEQGPAVGARTAVYRAAMFLAGGGAITVAKAIGWPAVLVLMALVYLPLLVVTRYAPEPEQTVVPPRDLEAAVWQPLIGFLSRPRALEIVAFVLLYKFADQLAQALLRPFLVDLGYDATQRGVAIATVSMLATVGGAFLGGVLTTGLGLGRALWLFGGIQIFSNLVYVALAASPVNVPLLWGALGFESFTQGLGTGAFSVLLMRLTERRFSATQYALFSSLFGLSRVAAGPLAGLMVDALGWPTFFWLTMLFGLPGLALLARFVPWSEADPRFTVETPAEGDEPRSRPDRRALQTRLLAGTVLGIALAASVSVGLEAIKGLREHPDQPFDLLSPALALVSPSTIGDWVGLFGILVCGVICGCGAAAVGMARHQQALQPPPVAALPPPASGGEHS